MSSILAVRCPRCGSTSANSSEDYIELTKMACQACGFTDICDNYEIGFDWKESIELADQDQPLVLPPVILPRGRYRAMMAALGVAEEHGPQLGSVFRALAAHYAEPQRAYHNAQHIGACLRWLDKPELAQAQYPAEVECAIWFHDAIYDTQAQDNEAQSAKWLGSVLQELGVEEAVNQRIQAHILATQHHQAESADGRLVLDVDLSILGCTESNYADFERAIRSEYAWVPAQLYATSRMAVLQRFLARPTIYRTPAFVQRFETQARTNLQGAVQQLAIQLNG
jgi:predicted metal-dependent HD superfamily phosphohydrolase